MGLGQLAFVFIVALLPIPVIGCSPHAAPPGTEGAPLVLPERYAHSVAALGFPGAKRAFQVGHGSVVGTGEAALEWRLTSTAGVVETSPVWFERDGVPVAHWSLVGSGQRVWFEAAAAPSKALGDTSLVLSVRAVAECIGRTPEDVVLECGVRSLPSGPHVVCWDAPERWVFDEAWRGHQALRNGRVVAVLDRDAAIASESPTPRWPAWAIPTCRPRGSAWDVTGVTPRSAIPRV